MNDDTRLWPIGLRRLAAIIGAAATVQLAEAFGGTEKNNIPKNPYRKHPFVNVIGHDNAVFKKLTTGYTVGKRAAMFHDMGARVYRL
ncbi:MAG: hypothetical protein WD767_03380 [Alphaproteobacteria bacterium]